MSRTRDTPGAKGVEAPGEDEKNWEMSENDQAVDPKEETHFRAVAARANYWPWTAWTCSMRRRRCAGGMARADEGTCEEIEEAHPIPH